MDIDEGFFQADLKKKNVPNFLKKYSKPYPVVSLIGGRDCGHCFVVACLSKCLLGGFAEGNCLKSFSLTFKNA